MSTLLRQTGCILRNDLRLLWRDVRSGKMRIMGNAFLLTLLLLGAHILSVFLFLRLKHTPPLGLEAGLWAFFGFLMLGAAMNQAISLFFERADFDLLLTAPITTRAVLLARITVLSVSAFLGAALLLMPLLDGIIIGFSLKYLSGYVVWSLLAVIAASAGVWLTLLLVRLLGARRARIWVQVLAAVLGASVYLGFQLQNHIPDQQKATFLATLHSAVEWLGFTHLARGGRSEFTALLLLAAVAGGIAFLTARQLARTFLAGMQESSASPTRRSRTGGKSYRFQGGLARATFLKDLRLILRDPLLLSQILPSSMYILPVFLGMKKLGGVALLAPVAIVIAVQFSNLLSEAAAAGEECLDLIRASPSAEIRLRLAKMAAGMALPLAASLLVCLVIAGFGRPWLALLTFITGATTAAGASWLTVARVSPTPRKDLMSRGRKRTSIGRSIAIGALLIGACIGISLIAQGSLWLLGLVALGLTALGVIACFTLVSVEEIDPETAASSWQSPPATTS
jgi:ABC-2 type transport system permease protein